MRVLPHAVFFAFTSPLIAGETPPPDFSYRVHAFYYPWYGNPDFSHWNHHVAVRKGPSRQYPGGDDIGANFYPLLGCYSSYSPRDLDRHMEMLRRARVGVVAVSWWGKGSFSHRSLPGLFASAEKLRININFHIEPHIGPGGRNARPTREAIVHLVDTYGSHSALYRDPAHGNRPFFYIYDSYLTKAT